MCFLTREEIKKKKMVDIERVRKCNFEKEMSKLVFESTKVRIEAT